MPITTKVIEGKVVTPSGVGWAGGTIYVRLSKQATVDDGGEQQVVADRLIITIGSDGILPATFKLVPNDIMTPADTVYIIEYFSTSGDKFREHWTIANTDASPIDIGDVTRVLVVPGGFVAGTLNGLTDTDVASPANDEVLTFQTASGQWEAKPGGAGGADTDAIHDNVVNEIALITEKTSPVDADLLVMEDSATGNAKRRLQMVNLPAGKQKVFTTAGKPAANLGNAYKDFAVKDTNQDAHGEIIYEDWNGIYQYKITWTS